MWQINLGIEVELVNQDWKVYLNREMIGDFQKQDISFDIDKLRNACNEVLKLKGFDTSLGIPHFAGISLNQIPNDKLDRFTGSLTIGDNVETISNYAFDGSNFTGSLTLGNNVEYFSYSNYTEYIKPI